MLKLEWLEAFVVFAEQLNFTHAAEQLHLSQPALHAQISKLGEALAVPLYRRKGRQLVLTADGQRVAAFGREVRDRTREFVGDLHGGDASQAVVLCAGEGAYLYLLGEAIQRHVAADPAPLRLLTRDREATLEAVRGGEAHVGVASLEGPPEGLEAATLSDVPQLLALPEGHPLAARRRALRLADLDGARLVVPPSDRPHRVLLGEALRAANVRWEIAVETSGWELTLRFVQLGIGLAVVNGCCRLPAGVVARPLAELPRRQYVAFRRRVATTGAAARLWRTLLATGGPHAARRR